MIDIIIEYAKEYGPIGLLVVAVAILTYKATKYYFSLERTRKTVEGLPCTEHSSRFSVISSLEDLAKSTNKIVVEISKWVMKIDPNMIDALQKSSPYRIMPYGWALLEKSQAKNCVDENFDFFKDRLNHKKPETEYDVENAAISLAAGSMDESFMNPVKEFLYHSPEKIKLTAIDDAGNNVEKELHISPLLFHQLIGIYVRDKYLALFPDSDAKFYINATS